MLRFAQEQVLLSARQYGKIRYDPDRIAIERLDQRLGNREYMYLSVLLFVIDTLLDGDDLVMRLEHLLEQRDQVQPLPCGSLEGSIVEIEPIYVDERAHR